MGQRWKSWTTTCAPSETRSGISHCEILCRRAGRRCSTMLFCAPKYGCPAQSRGPPLNDSSAFRASFSGVVLAVIVSSLDQNIVAVALPRIARELGGLSYISWIVTAFLLTATIAAPIYGKLSDIYGRRRMLTVSMSVFLGTTVLCSLVNTIPQLIAARALQGLGAGGLVTLSQSTIGDLVGPRQRGRYQGYFSGAMGISTVLGPLLGGALIADFSWRGIFLVTIPVGIASLALIRWGLPKSFTSKPHRIDYSGVLLLVIATSAALSLFNTLESGLISRPLTSVGLAAVAIVCVTLFLRQERRAAEPLLGLSLFGNSTFVAGVIAAGMMTFAMQGAMVFLPLYFQDVQGMTPTHSGLMLVAQIAGLIFSSILGGQLSARSGQFKKFLIAGVAMEMAAIAALAILALARAGEIPFLAALGLLGLGTGLGMPNAVVIVQNSVPRASLGVATASMSFLRSLGGAFGVAISGCVMHFVFDSVMRINSHLVDPLRPAIAASFALGATMMLLALMTIVAKLPTPPRR
jgi:EmrB/QacA subfamily drug resistance transporter